MTDSLLVNLEQLINISVSYTLLFFINRKIYEPRIEGKVRIAAYIFMFTINMLIVHTVRNSYINFLFYVLSSVALCSLLFKASIKKTLLYTLFYCIFNNFADIISTITVASITHNLISDMLSDPKLMFVTSIINNILALLIYKVYGNVLASKELFSMRLKETLFIVFLTLFEFFVLYCITVLTVSVSVMLLTVTVAGFLVLNIYALYVMDAMAAGYKDKCELEAIKIQNQIQLSHYEELNRKYSETRRMIHDIEKHISAIERLAENGDFPEADRYTAKLRDELKKYGSLFECTNKILSAVLSQKISLAESKGITVKTEIENLTLDFMDETDITSIFANLMDNAIEACEELPDDKIISVKMCRINDFIFIDMVNSFSGKLSRSGGGFRTTKIGHMGYGMASIKMAVEKYHGYMTTDQEDGKFISEILIPIE